MSCAPSPLVARFIRRYNSAYVVGVAQAAARVTASSMGTARGVEAPKQPGPEPV